MMGRVHYMFVSSRGDGFHIEELASIVLDSRQQHNSYRFSLLFDYLEYVFQG